MRSKLIASKLLVGSLLAAAVAGPALAQTAPPAAPPSSPPAAATAPAPRANGDMWRASKLMGLDIYNDQNEKLGDVSEILIDKSGDVKGVVIGVGGFLGIGQHDIMVEMAKLRFVNEPTRTSSTTTTGATGATTGAGGGMSRPSTTTTTTTTNSASKWYPDHAVLSGVTRDQLKNMPAFKYE